MDELERVRRLYPDTYAMAAILHGRSTAATAHKARYLGLVPPRRFWSQAEILALRHPYVSGMPVRDIQQLLPGRSKTEIWRRAHRSGYRRPRSAPRATGFPIVDSVRRRAHDYRLTMRDLDAFVGKRCYFTSPRQIDWKALQRAVAILGGTPFVVWDET